MNKPTKILKKILEIVWLIVAIMAFGIAVRETLYNGFNNSYYYYLFSAISFFFYFSRRKERINKD